MSENIGSAQRAMDAFRDEMLKDNDLVSNLRKYPGEIQILYAGADAETAIKFSKTFDYIGALTRVESIDDLIFPGEDPKDAGEKHLKMKGLTLVILPSLDYSSKPDTKIEGFVKGMSGSFAGTGNYLLISPSSERDSFKGDFVKGRLNLDSPSDSKKMIEKLKLILGKKVN